MMAYLVQNITATTIILSDLRAEIPPKASKFDLEMVAKRRDIESSYDLIRALDTGRLKLLGNGVKMVPSVLNKPELNEDRIEAIVRRALQANRAQSSKHDNIQEEIAKAMTPVVDRILDAIAQKSFAGGLSEKASEPAIDPAKLAEIQQKAINKELENLESNQKESGKKVVIKNNLNKIANELADAD
jgi:hypothetical protein